MGSSVIWESKLGKQRWISSSKVGSWLLFWKGSEQFVEHITGENSRDLRFRGIHGGLSISVKVSNCIADVDLKH